MRIVVFFDLPTETAENKRDYRQFHKLLIGNGFIMMQESVYCRMVLNQSVEASVIEVLRRNRPPAGIVQVLTVTEKQFAGMKYLVGENTSEMIDSTERLVIL
ncbi:MAG: CRISPR-associated endonuclease Cas2 [Clostridia bacterium]|nr:CRISPR-associated endonuclease Cas2 [Clostridia bacterium]